MFTLEVKDEVTPAITSVVHALISGMVLPRDATMAVGRAAEQLTKDHFADLSAERHRGHVAHNFYKDAADSVKLGEVTDDSASIRIDKAGVAQRLYGGKIEAKNYSHLWIPISGTDAEGKTGGDFDDLDVFISPLTNKGVAKRGDEVLFALVESLTQDPDPTVLPSDEDYQYACSAAVSGLLDDAFAERIDQANKESL